MQTETGINYFDTMGMARKSYSRLMVPICKKWDLTRNALDVLLFLYNNPRYDRAADIVAHRGIAKSHVSLSVSDLESREFLRRRVDPTDRRTAHLELTEAGKNIAAEAREVQHRYFESLYQGVTGEELALWREVICKVCENIQNLDKTLETDGYTQPVRGKTGK